MTRKLTRAWQTVNGTPAVQLEIVHPHTRSRITLPKQWRHWCRKAGLRIDGRGQRDRHAWCLLKGAGRRWRVTLTATFGTPAFQVSERHATFDRWANSVCTQYPLPKTYTELLLRVRFTTYDT